MTPVVKVTLDADTFKALASPTRLGVMRALDERRKTVSELARDLDMNKATIHEHLQLLTASGLVNKVDEGRKWIYYELTWRGERILHPQETTTFNLLLGISVAAAGGGVAMMGRALGWWLQERAFDLSEPAPETGTGPAHSTVGPPVYAGNGTVGGELDGPEDGMGSGAAATGTTTGTTTATTTTATTTGTGTTTATTTGTTTSTATATHTTTTQTAGTTTTRTAAPTGTTTTATTTSTATSQPTAAGTTTATSTPPPPAGGAPEADKAPSDELRQFYRDDAADEATRASPAQGQDDAMAELTDDGWLAVLLLAFSLLTSLLALSLRQRLRSRPARPDEQPPEATAGNEAGAPDDGLDPQAPAEDEEAARGPPTDASDAPDPMAEANDTSVEDPVEKAPATSQDEAQAGDDETRP